MLWLWKLTSLSALDFLILCLIVFPEMALRLGSLLSLSELFLLPVFQNWKQTMHVSPAQVKGESWHDLHPRDPDINVGQSKRKSCFWLATSSASGDSFCLMTSFWSNDERFQHSLHITMLGVSFFFFESARKWFKSWRNSKLWRCWLAPTGVPTLDRHPTT